MNILFTCHERDFTGVVVGAGTSNGGSAANGPLAISMAGPEVNCCTVGNNALGV